MGLAVPLQVEPCNPIELWWILHGATPAQEKRTFVLESKPGVKGPNTEVDRNEEFLDVKRGDANVLRYNVAITPLPPDAHPNYKRSGYINPVWTPKGEVTTDRARDYLHQIGIWLAYTQTTFEGRTPNFWDLLSGNATIQFAGLESTTSGPAFDGFRVRQNHFDLTAPDGKRAAS